MCFALFGCCGPPPHATIKAYNNTTPFALDWFDDRDGGGGGIRETAICDWNDESGYTIGVLSAGTGSDGLGILLERDSDDGDQQTDANNGGASITTSMLLKATPVSGPSGGAWLHEPDTSTQPQLRGRIRFFDLDLLQQCNVTLPQPIALGATTTSWTNSFGLSGSLGIVTGFAISQYTLSGGTIPSSALIAREYSSSGSVSASLLKSGLTAGPRTQYGTLIPRSDSNDECLVFGVGTGTSRKLWRFSKTSMTETAVGTQVSTTIDGLYRVLSTLNERQRASRINSTYAILHLSDGDNGTSEANATIVCVELSDGFGNPAEKWTKNDKDRQFAAMDSTQVYTVDGAAGELSAVTLSTGAEAWTLDLSDDAKLGTGTGQVYGAVLSSGNIAVWRNAGVTIVTTAGTEVATVDVGPCYGIVEKSNRWIIVGGKRTTSS